MANVVYQKLWAMCSEQEVRKADLRKRAGISSAAFTKRRESERAALTVLLKPTDVINCRAATGMAFTQKAFTDHFLSKNGSSFCFSKTAICPGHFL